MRVLTFASILSDPTRIMSAVMDNFSPSTFLQMPCRAQGFPDMPDKLIHFSTERSFVR